MNDPTNRPANRQASEAPLVAVELTVNGERLTVTVDIRATLLDTLREALDLTGTKKSCDRGECGACTIHADGRRVNACMMLTVMQAGRDIRTIEGVAREGRLHPLQQAFIDCDGLQCGFCTSGQIMSGIACLDEGHAGSAAEIREWMSGNICRCSAYPGIVQAILSLAGKP